MIDLKPHFKNLRWRPMAHSNGVLVASDFADYPEDHPVLGLYKQCGFWTEDEIEILFATAQQIGGTWLDIGCHTGWTAAHLAAACASVIGVDPMLKVHEFRARFRQNTVEFPKIWARPGTSNEFFESCMGALFSGVVIDGDHLAPCPLEDARNAADHLEERGAVLFHDCLGEPVQQGVIYLRERGFKSKVYRTPHGVALCWRGEFEPPEYVPDELVFSAVDQHLRRLYHDN